MKLKQAVKSRVSPRLFNDKWQYKTAVVCPAAAWFRGNNLSHTSEKFDEWRSGSMSRWDCLKIKTIADFDYCVAIYNILKDRDDYALRVEHPILNLYTDNQDLAYELANLDTARTKFVYIPPTNQTLEEHTVILKRIDYGYKVTMGRCRKAHNNFAQWAEKSKHIKISKRSLELMRKSNFGGHYFYVKDDAAMTMVKMFLGSDIARIDKVISATK